MNGPEHYTEAERLLAGRTVIPEVQAPYHVTPTADDIAAAQVHATLALAAATVTAADVAAAAGDVGSRGLDRWHDALAPLPVQDEDDEAGEPGE
jgi:hypothetical protein